MIRYFKSLTLRQRANGILCLMAVLYCFVFVGQFFYDGESWYQPLYWAVQSALIGSVADWFAGDRIIPQTFRISLSYGVDSTQ